MSVAVKFDSVNRKEALQLTVEELLSQFAADLSGQKLLGQEICLKLPLHNKMKPGAS